MLEGCRSLDPFAAAVEVLAYDPDFGDFNMAGWLPMPARAGSHAAWSLTIRLQTASVASSRERDNHGIHAMDRATLAALSTFPQQLEAFFEIIPANRWRWKPGCWEGIPSEPFSAIEQICHVRDIEVEGYHARFRRALQETRPVLANVDGEALAVERAYTEANPGEVFAAFRAARTRTLEVVAAFTPEQWERAAVFDGAPITVRGLVHMLCSHDQQHLAGLQWLMARIDASRLS
ncbi:MAG: DinB family protein [Pseudoxanthomonas sp.]